jgi:branched-chain amino acid transport system ATP-binding protein
MSGEAILEARDVSKEFGGFQALAGVNLTLSRGERRALIGPNGAGKSTFINVVGGQLPSTGGDIRFHGKAISRLQPHQIARLGIARSFQISRTYLDLTVYENMITALLMADQRTYSVSPSLLAERHEAACEMLNRVGLADRARSPATDISHADRKRLEFGMALAGNPALLMLDEPTAGMGLHERLELMDMVVEHVTASGITLLFVEHDIDVVFKVAERITVMARGQTFVEGTPAEIAENEAVQDIYLGTGH